MIIGAVELVKELERGGRLGEDFDLISMIREMRRDRGGGGEREERERVDGYDLIDS